MKNIILVVLFILVSTLVFAETQPRPLTVAIWSSIKNDLDSTRFINEMETSLLSSKEFGFAVEREATDNADFHIVVRTIVVDNKDSYVWAIGITPIQDPTFCNTYIRYTNNSITGVNQAARSTVQILEELVYLMLDYYSSRDA